MHDPLEDDVAVFYRIYSPPIALAQSENTGFSCQGNHRRMRCLWRRGNLFKALQKPLDICFRHAGELLDDSGRYEKGHIAMIANSEYGGKFYSLLANNVHPDGTCSHCHSTS